MKISNKLLVTFMAMAFILFVSGIFEITEARSRSGGRSFGQSRSYSRPSGQPNNTFSNQNMRQSNSPFSSSGSFMRGVAGGIVGGVLGGMLFGGLSHATGMGGIGGSGIGLIEILLFAGLAFFLFKLLKRRAALSPNNNFDSGYRGNNAGTIENHSSYEEQSYPPEANDLVNGVKQIWQVDQDFDPEKFKEIAQDLFFKIQAAWTRRDVSILKPLVGEQLLSEYAQHFAEMKKNGQINRLENIAVRKIELVNAGIEGSEIFVTIHFNASILDYTIDEKTGQVIAGSSENPVKFDERWTFSREIGYYDWKLEGIES